MKSFMTRVVISLTVPIICFGCSTTDNWAINPIYENVEETHHNYKRYWQILIEKMKSIETIIRK